MQRDITRSDVRELVRRGLQESHGSYKLLVALFNMDSADYKKFLNFLRKHDCQLPYREYRVISTPSTPRDVSPGQDQPVSVS
jgi:hypothetical protein